ncbi:hypothetical protein JW935_22990 [candidate division KSB1 bacterium]|nr:hypothetical protein [candidate division KSB1 bacterium]
MKKQKKMLAIVMPVMILSLTLFSQSLTAQVELNDRASGFSIGGGLHRIQENFGMDLCITSPYFAGEHIALQLSAKMSYLNGIPANETEFTWMPYNTVTFGLIGVGGSIAKSIRLYGKGGLAFLMPNSDFSGDNVVGGYGVFGFEFFVASEANAPVSYYIELGGIGTGAKAEKLPGKPLYSNGFITAVGFKYYF